MKRLLALLLALAMVFCLAACNNTKAPNEENTPEENTPEEQTPALPSAKFGLSVADLDALVKALASSDPGLDIEDLYFEIGSDDDMALLSLGAKMLDKDYNIDLFLGEEFVLNAPALLDKAYGIKLADLPGWYESLMTAVVVPGVDTDAMVSYSSSAGANSVLGMMQTVDTEKAGALIEKYYNLIISELKATSTVSSSEENGRTVLTGSLDATATATILVNVIEALFADDDFFALAADMSGMTIDEVKQELTQDKPSKDELLGQIKPVLSEANMIITINSLTLDSDNLPVAMDLKFSAGSGSEAGTIALVYDLDALTLSFNMDVPGTKMSLSVGDGVFDLSATAEGQSIRLYFASSDTGFTGYAEQNGTKLFETTLTITETELTFKLNVQGSELVINSKITDDAAEGTMTMDGEEMAKVTFDRVVDGNKETYTLKALSVQGQSIDFADAGISFYVETDIELPAAPSYTNIAELDAEDFEAIGEKFATDNADLFEKFSGLGFGSSTDELPNYDDDFDWDDTGDWNQNADGF